MSAPQVEGFMQGLGFGTCSVPEGFKDPNKRVQRVLGPKYHKYYSISPLKPYYLGPWTLRGRVYDGTFRAWRCHH